jgi:hypothetical protein
MSDAWLFIFGTISVILLFDLLIAVLVIKICRMCGYCDDPDNPQGQVHLNIQSVEGKTILLKKKDPWGVRTFSLIPLGLLNIHYKRICRAIVVHLHYQMSER